MTLLSFQERSFDGSALLESVCGIHTSPKWPAECGGLKWIAREHWLLYGSALVLYFTAVCQIHISWASSRSPEHDSWLQPSSAEEAAAASFKETISTISIIWPGWVALPHTVWTHWDKTVCVCGVCVCVCKREIFKNKSRAPSAGLSSPMTLKQTHTCTGFLCMIKHYLFQLYITLTAIKEAHSLKPRILT